MSSEYEQILKVLRQMRVGESLTINGEKITRMESGYASKHDMWPNHGFSATYRAYMLSGEKPPKWLFHHEQRKEQFFAGRRRYFFNSGRKMKWHRPRGKGKHEFADNRTERHHVKQELRKR